MCGRFPVQVFEEPRKAMKTDSTMTPKSTEMHVSAYYQTTSRVYKPHVMLICWYLQISVGTCFLLRRPFSRVLQPPYLFYWTNFGETRMMWFIQLIDNGQGCIFEVTVCLARTRDVSINFLLRYCATPIALRPSTLRASYFQLYEPPKYI
jgi:hypothetical protein